ncbi:MAG TPA: hypothetical protein VK620_33910 [Bradyrhizobium sp.]|nr:hypothetical protein [Bradyrhizobium sp.]
MNDRRPDDSGLAARLALMPADLKARVDIATIRYAQARTPYNIYRTVDADRRRVLAQTVIEFHAACDAALAWLGENGTANAAPQDGPPRTGVPSSGRTGDSSEERTGHKAEDTT